MPRLVPSRLVSVCALALLLTLSTAAVAAARVAVDLRVIAGGEVLTEQSLKTGTTAVPTSPKATCFGKADAGSGKGVTVKGATAFGALAQASKSTASLRPFRVTDAFSFGLGLCEVGGYKATRKLSWYLKVNHENPELGGDTVKLKKGDEVLWALAAFPYPNELALVAPTEATAGVPFEATVFSYDDKGKRRPAAGATVSGAATPTDANGHTQVALSAPTVLVATKGKDLPSNAVDVPCVSGLCAVP